MSAVFCNASLNYIDGNQAGPVPTDILNGREFENPGWEEAGFELRSHHSAVSSWDDPDQMVDVYYEEMSTLAKQLTGCRHALVGGHIRRNPEQARLHSDLGPIRFAHSDFTENYGELMRSYYTSEDDESQVGLRKAGIGADEVRAAKRMLILQFWRNIGEPRMDLPLAFCDARTVPRNDMVSIPVSDYAGGGFNFDAFGVHKPAEPTHGWYVFPDLTADEVVVFRTFDDECVNKGRPFWTPHAAFNDPRVPEGSPARDSIEVRATCLFY